MPYRALAVVVLTVALCACSASIPVTHIRDMEMTALGEGTLLVLPETEMTLKYAITSRTFTAGVWTHEIEACGRLVKDLRLKENEAQDCGAYTTDIRVDDQCCTTTTLGGRIMCKTPDVAKKTLFDRITSAKKRLVQTCLLSRELGLSSKRLSLANGALQCANDGGNTEFRKAFDADALSVSAEPIPDPNHVYWVAMPIKTFGDASVTVTYGEQGTVTGAKAVVSSPFAGFAVDVAGIATKAMLGGFGSAEAIAKVDRQGKPLYNCVVLQGAECQKYGEALDELKADIDKKGDLALTASGDGLAAVLELLDANIERKKEPFTGTVAVSSNPQSFAWLPPADIEASCKNRDEKVAGAWPHACGKIVVPACSAVGDPPTDQKPEYILTFTAARAAESEKWIAVAKKTLEDTRASTGSNGRHKDRGFPYRVSALADISAQIIKKGIDGKESEAGGMKPVQQYVAQFGEVGRLAPRAGGRKSTIDIKYYVNSGSLQSVSVEREGADPKAILDPVKEALTPSAPKTEADALKAEKDRLTLLKDICVAAKELSKPLPVFCKQPESVPES